MGKRFALKSGFYRGAAKLTAFLALLLIPAMGETGELILGVHGGFLKVQPGAVADALSDMADTGYVVFRSAYGALDGSSIRSPLLSRYISSNAVSLRRPIGGNWGWQSSIGLTEFESESRVEMAGSGGETLRQYWKLDFDVVPVMAGFWMESEVRHKVVVRGSAGIGLTVIDAEFLAYRRFVGAGRDDEYGGSYPLSGCGLTGDVSGTVGLRMFSWLEIFLEAGFLAVVPATLKFRNDADANLDGYTEYDRGDVLTDGAQSPTALSLSNWHAAACLELRL